MKILAFADIHGSNKALKMLKEHAKDVDLIICCGDMTVFSTDLDKIMKKIASLGKDVLVIHGNHEDPAEVRKECAKYENLYFMHKKVKKIKGITFFGHGGGGFSFVSKEFEEFMKKNKGKHGDVSILITHQPPFETDLDVVWGDEHVGSKSYKKYIKDFNLVFCGHIHETQGIVQEIDKTALVNPGPAGALVEL